MAGNAFLETMGLRISSRRKELHMTQEQLAEKVGISLQSISCIELGKKAVRPENLAKLCVCLSVSSDYILFGKREAQQMTDVIEALATLNTEEYNCIQEVIRLFHKQ